MHLLVIGVGAYRNQVDCGNAPKAGPVTAVARSAKAVLEWASGAASKGHFSPELKSVHAAISEPGTPAGAVVVKTPGGEVNAEDPTLPVLRALVDAWLADVDAHPENVAFVYLSGHGIANDTSLLLAEDYGSLRRNPYYGLIDINGFFTSLQTTQAGTVLMFADCCREFEEGAFHQLNQVTGEAFGSSDFRRMNDSARILVKATEPGGAAMANPDGRTYFCDGLLFALNGAAAQGQTDGRWNISASDLYSSLEKATEEVTGKRITTSWDMIGAPVIVSLASAPEVEIQIQTNPRLAILKCKIGISHQDGGVPDLSPPSAITYKVKLPQRDHYVAKAEFASGGYQNEAAGFSAQFFRGPIIIKTPVVP